MDGLNEMWRRWVRCTQSYVWDGAGARKEDRRKRFDKLQQRPGSGSSVQGEIVSWVKRLNNKVLIPVHSQPDRKKHLGKTIDFFFFSMTWWKVWSSAAHELDKPCNQSPDDHFPGQARSASLLTRSSNSLVCPWLVWTEVRGQRSDLVRISYRIERAGPKTERLSKQTPPHTEGEGTPLASLPAGPSAPRRWWWRPLSAEMHNVHTWERLLYTVRRSSL